MDIKQILCLLAAILLFLYGSAIRAVGSGTKFFLVWIGFGLICLLSGILIHFRIPEMMPHRLMLLIRGAVVLAILVFVVTEAAIGSHFSDHGEAGLDYIIVLGAQMKTDGPSVVLRYRLEKAAEYLEENPDTVCIVTGAQGYNEPCSEADGMAEYLIRKGIPEDRIIREDEAVNTVQNIRYSSAFFDPETDTVGIVTNNFHLYRALHIAEKQGLRNMCGIAAGSKVFYMPNNCMREFLGVMKDLVKGNMTLGI